MSDEPTGRDLSTIWKVACIAGSLFLAAIAAAWVLLTVVVPWSNALALQDSRHDSRLDGHKERIDSVEKRLDAVEREMKWHQRGHAPGSSFGGRAP